MKKFLVILFVFSIVGGYVLANPTATLNLEGTVAPVVMVYLDGIAEGEDTVTFNLIDAATGELDTATKHSVGTLKELANTTYSLTVSSDNGFELIGEDTSGEIAYELLDATDAVFASKTGQSATAAAGLETDLYVRITEGTNTFPAPDTYKDTITFVISADS